MKVKYFRDILKLTEHLQNRVYLVFSIFNDNLFALQVFLFFRTKIICVIFRSRDH